jgi:hypothetical protein
MNRRTIWAAAVAGGLFLAAGATAAAVTGGDGQTGAPAMSAPTSTTTAPAGPSGTHSAAPTINADDGSTTTSDPTGDAPPPTDSTTTSDPGDGGTSPTTTPPDTSSTTAPPSPTSTTVPLAVTSIDYLKQVGESCNFQVQVTTPTGTVTTTTTGGLGGTPGGTVPGVQIVTSGIVLFSLTDDSTGATVATENVVAGLLTAEPDMFIDGWGSNTCSVGPSGTDGPFTFTATYEGDGSTYAPSAPDSITVQAGAYVG